LIELAPSPHSRVEIAEAGGRDPLWVATLRAWEAGAELKLLTRRPELALADGRVVSQSDTGERAWYHGGLADWGVGHWFGSRTWEKIATASKDCSEKTSEVIGRLDREIKEADAQKTTPRARAMAETVLLYLKASRLNTLSLHRYCADKVKADQVVDPDAWLLARVERAMCHGGSGLVGPGLTGGADDEWAKFGKSVDAHIAKYRATPWEVLARRLVLLSYSVYVPPPPTTAGGTTERPKPASETEGAPTKSGRPSRGSTGSGSTGAPGGTTTKD